MTADEWNALYPVGTPVMAYPSCRPEYDAAVAAEYRLVTVTRSRAWNLGHGAPVVAVEGYSAKSTARHINHGTLSHHYAPAGAFETRVDLTDTGATLYARYIGDTA